MAEMNGEALLRYQGYKKELPIVEYRKCLKCGAEFGITGRQHSKKYCDDCKFEHYKELRQKWLENPENYKRNLEMSRERNRNREKHHKVYTCALCGQEFQSHTRGKTKYCMECLYKHRYEHPYRVYLHRRVNYEGGDD